MCKLFAYVNQEQTTINYTLGSKINRVLQHLFYINSFGQTDGSGLMWTNSKGESMYLKDSVPSPTLMQFNSFTTNKLDFYKHKWVAGHTRYSTVGSNTWENSHPFLHGKYLGMQNGTIYNDHTTLVEGKISPCAVDSSSVFWAFAQQGVEKTFEAYEGAGVFMYIDTEEKTFNIVKNYERDLHIVKIVGIDAYLITTDKYALELVCNRANLAIEEVHEVDNDTLYTFSFAGVTTKTPLEVKAIKTVVYDDAYWSAWEKQYIRSTYDSTYGSKRTSGKTYPKRTSSKASKPVVKFKSKQPVSTTTSLSYVTDCDICSSPLMTDDLVFADSSEPSSASVFCCSGCVLEAKRLTGKSMYRVELSKEKV